MYRPGGENANADALKMKFPRIYYIPRSRIKLQWRGLISEEEGVGFIPTRREKRNSKESLELIRHYFINYMHLLCIVFVCHRVLCAVL